ncbi:MAG: hypothetical protein PHU14_14320, partial [Methylovulum sp.]|nr:hypothetical protein [Methylovulum sp.]
MTDPSTLTAVAAAATASAHWLWENYGDNFSDWLKKKAEEKVKEKGGEFVQTQWQHIQWQKAEKAYKAKLAKLYGTTRILGHSEPTPLEGIFTDLYILDKPLALRRYDVEQLKNSDETLYGHNL